MQRNTEFGTLLTSTRLAAGYSQREVADFTRMSRSAYGHMESCIRKPTAEFILRISALYHTNPIVFLLPLVPEDMHTTDKSFVHYLSILCTPVPNTTSSRRKRKRISAHKPKS